MEECINLFIRIQKEKVIDFCAFFEYFEGLAAIRTPNPEAGEMVTLQVMVTTGFYADLEILLKRIKNRIPWTLIN